MEWRWVCRKKETTKCTASFTEQSNESKHYNKKHNVEKEPEAEE